MQTVLIVLHLMIVLALVVVVLLQRSEGGALGMGGGGGGFMSSRGQGNVLTRTTAILAFGFFATSLTLAVLAGYQRAPSIIIDPASQVPTSTNGAAPSGGLLPALQGKPAETPSAPAQPQAPISGTNAPPPAAPAAVEPGAGGTSKMPSP